MKNHRGKRFSAADTIEKQKASNPSQQPSLSALQWKDRVDLSRQQTGGGRNRALVKPSGKQKSRQVGGMLRSTIPKGRKEISEKQRQALPKTGDQVPKKGINASNWGYDHRKTVAERRSRGTVGRDLKGEKKGINAEKWHYDHQKAKKAEGTTKSGPTTHVAAEKKKTQAEAIAKHQPKQRKKPVQPQLAPPSKPKPPTRKR